MPEEELPQFYEQRDHIIKLIDDIPFALPEGQIAEAKTL